MDSRVDRAIENITRPGEFPLGETSALFREASRHTSGDVPLCRPHGKGGDMAAMNTAHESLVAVDFSEESDRALDAAVELSRQFGAELHLVHAFDRRIVLMAPYSVAAFFDEAEEKAASRLGVLVEKVAAEGISATSHLVEAPAASAIVDLAEELGADLTIMGTRGRTGLNHVLLGSVGERTLRHARCSVLTVKASSG